MQQRIEVTTYFLEMRGEPSSAPIQCPESARVVRAESLTGDEYLALYHGVGEPWLWYERSALAPVEVSQLIDAAGVSIFLLEHKGETAGFCELHTSPEQETQILYFGLLGPFIGAGLGSFFLDWTVRKAFETSIDRLWVHTCSLDHPRALAAYEKTGFSQYRKESGWVTIPETALDKQKRATCSH